MELLRVDPAAPDPAAIARAAAVLRAGGLVAFPTETVYGLGADALDPAAVARIFAAKGRPATNPLIVHVPDLDAARALVRHWPPAADRLAARWWPGPLTLVLPKRPAVPDAVTAGLDAVALRVPAHPVALALIAAAGRPIAAPSANRYTRLSPTTAAHVVESLGARVDLVLDGGPTTVGIESTVVDLTGERPVLLRPGMVSAAELETVVGPLDAVTAVAESAPRVSPGLAARHYAPRARLEIVAADVLAGADANPFAAGVARERIGAVVIGADAPAAGHIVRLPPDPKGYARDLYGTLHGFDALGCALVLVEAPPATAAWAAVRDRLARAAHR